jgi:quercetin dioxygenase-like cupin family protein
MVGDTYTIKATAASTGGAFGLVEASVPPGSGPPPHVHSREDEAFYLIDGVLELSTEGREAEARTGDFVFLPRGNVHSFRNPGLTPIRMLVIITPGGFEQYFADAGTPARPGEQAPPADRANFARIAELSARYGTQLGGPGPVGRRNDHSTGDLHPDRSS